MSNNGATHPRTFLALSTPPLTSFSHSHIWSSTFGGTMSSISSTLGCACIFKNLSICLALMPCANAAFTLSRVREQRTRLGRTCMLSGSQKRFSMWMWRDEQV